MSQPSDSTAVRTAGFVLCVIGVVTALVAMAWNRMGSYPAEESLVEISGTVVLAEHREVPTRTAIEKWDVVEVESEGKPVRWVFPEHGVVFDTALETLAVGEPVRARAQAAPERLRWSEVPVRVIWSLGSDSGVVVRHEDSVQVLYDTRSQSPMAGWLVLGVGIALVLVSRIRLGQELHTES